MLIFLADTVHNTGRLSPNTVPYNVARIAAYCQSKHPDHTYVLFKDPYELIEQLRAAHPQVLAISNYFWNTRLNHHIIRFAKNLYPDLTVIVGGPNLDRRVDAYQAYALQHPETDFVAMEEGETTFEGLVSAIEQKGTDVLQDIKSMEVPGTFAILGPGEIHVSSEKPRLRSLDDFPSPYLNGMLDDFLAQGMHPIVEFVSGCPYQCAFCQQGSQYFSKLAMLSLSRIYEEVDYIRDRCKVGRLIVADVNFGIVKRDLEVAKYLKNSYEQHNWPTDLYLYHAKVPTEHTLECIETLQPIAALCMSFQSTDSSVLKNIHRSNIGYDKYSFITKWAKAREIPVGTELIYGLPGETRESFINGYEALFQFRADYVNSYNLRLFAGTELNAPAVREQYGMKTRFRPMDTNLGEYVFDRPERIMEIEEIVITTDSLTEHDFFDVRQIGLLIESLWNTGYLRPALAFLADRDSSVTQVFEEIISTGSKDVRAMEFFAHYMKLAREELEADSEVLLRRTDDDHYWKMLMGGRGVNMKLNLAFAGWLWLFQNQVDEFFYETIRRFASDFNVADMEAFEDVLAYCLAAKPDLDHPEPKFARLLYDVPAWVREAYPPDISRFRLSTRTVFTYTLAESTTPAALKIKDRLSKGGASQLYIAERMMMELPKRDRLSRHVSQIGDTDQDFQEIPGGNLSERVAWIS